MLGSASAYVAIEAPVGLLRRPLSSISPASYRLRFSGSPDDVVRRRNFLEAPLGLGIARMQIGVRFLGELAVRLADVVLRGVFADAQHFVRVGHASVIQVSWSVRYPRILRLGRVTGVAAED